MTVSDDPPSSISADERAQAGVVPRDRDPRTLPWLCVAVVLISALASTATAMNVWTMAVVFLCSIVSTIAGFAFSALAGAVLFQMHTDPVYVVGVLLVSSISASVYTVWSIRRTIDWRELSPYLAGGAIAILPGVYLLLHIRPEIYLFWFGCFLFGYGAFSLAGQQVAIRRDCLAAKLSVGALGGLTGALTAFPGAFIVIWCRARNMDKHRQHAVVQPFIVLMQLLTLGSLAIVRPERAVPALSLLQFVAPAILGAYGGLALYHRFTTPQVNRLITAVLLVSGLILAARAF